MAKGIDEGLSVRANLIWNSIGNFAYLVSQWLFTYIVTSIMGFESAGVYALAVSISSTFFTIASYSMRNFQASDINLTYADSVYTASRWLTSAIATVACIVFSLANQYPTDTMLCISLYMLFKATEALSDVYQGVMQLRMRMDYIGISFLIKSILELAVFVIVLQTTRNLTIALGALFLSSLFVVLLYDSRKASHFYTPTIPKLHDITTLLIACLPTAIYGLLFAAAGQLPRYFIEFQMGTEALGYYSSIAMPVAIIQVSASFIFSPLVTPLAQALNAGDTRRFISTIGRVIAAIVLIAVVGIIGFSLLGEWFYTLLFGETISPYLYLTIPLIACSVLVALSWFLATALTVMRKLKTLVCLSFVALLIVLIGTLPCIKLFGMNGATWIYILALAFFSSGCFIIIAHHLIWKDSHGTR